MSINMARDISTFEQLDGLTQINNVPISVIEDRARPGQWSAGGFLTDRERLSTVLKEDWKTVSSLGLTHIEIANHLNRIIQNANSSPQNTQERNIFYDFSEIQGAKLPHLIKELNQETQKPIFERFVDIVSMRFETVCKVEGIYNKILAIIESFTLIYQRTFNPSNLVSRINVRLVCEPTSGLQDDIFRRGGGMMSSFGCVVAPWCEDYVFTNSDTGKSIRVARGVIDYIERFGFYEGKVPYRLDPLELISVLTGADVSRLQTLSNTKRRK